MDKRTPIFRSLAIIEERIREKLTVENLADSIHFSKFHYQRLFQETVGESVMRYVTRRRLTLAAEELVNTRETVLQIALKYGYDSHEGFTRSFRAYMGVTPKEYRKYHLSGSHPGTQKEECKMKYSKTTDEIIRELNSLIVHARETAEFTRKGICPEPEAAGFYSEFWEYIASTADYIAEELTKTLAQINSLTCHPDEISARFLIIKAIEDAAFLSSVTAFQVRLTISRALPEHREAFQELCGKYDDLSRNTRMKTERIVKFFVELSNLIFQDMRENAGERIRRAVEQGKAATKCLMEQPGFPYAYIAEEVLGIALELEALPLDEITVSGLEDYEFRMDIILLAAETDMLRAPSHKSLFTGVLDFKEEIRETIRCFQNLYADINWTAGDQEKTYDGERKAQKACSDMAFQGNILLFYLKGEVQKLESRGLEEEQKTAFDNICRKMNETIVWVRRGTEEKDLTRCRENLQELCGALETEADRLDVYGAPVRFIAEEIKRM